ncbi:TIM barrel protein [Sinorhizobium medicae]|uniref:2-oxo-tetronate isomerase n=1 Tax=Sinorhizobium medicae TaxID=110321 RepID=UPI000FDAE545|nr:2-oxo-tetronate isomerase [Sinorhizobium medicae]MDX0624851.1 TIM barrel protein [Sinorhizobium medicae]MDX0877531.1 TIM barrel protein [Sinorhizobium medicae]RVH90153.1 hydroxypyruvate isomerase [Sinorhizobium medicae]RVP70518.1 hydroxypyruvate isomerase [Sinorhizobium medicae]
MPVFAANLTMMFNEWTFLDRFDAAAEAGFTAVEYLFPYEVPPEAIAERLIRNRLEQALFNLPPGDWVAGERGIAALPGRFDELKSGVDKALYYAAATGAKRLHLMAGLSDPSDPEAASCYRRSIAYTAGRLAEKSIDLLIEPINGRNMPGYFLDDFAKAERLIAELALPNLKLQFDVYHRQIMHGDVAMALRHLLPVTGHIQIASVPSRHEPDGEELNYSYLFKEIDRLGYDGHVGCEYFPRGSTLDGLAWFNPFRRS